MVKIRAIIFDMDGVLIHAKDWHYQALNQALNDFGYASIGREEHIATFDGLPTRRKLALLAQSQPIPEAEFEDINRVKQRHTRAIIEREAGPTPHHVEALSKLKADGYRMAVCSNSVRDSIRLLMGRAELMPYLEFFLSYEDVGAFKPDPAIYREAITRLGVAPEEILILEDHPNGIRAAKASGAHVMQITSVSEVTYAAITARIRAIEAA